MEYTIYKFEFTTPVHFGNKSIEKTSNTFSADTLFSAMCIESLKIKGSSSIEELVSLVKNGQLKISDGLPYFQDRYFIPKPIMQIKQTKYKEYETTESMPIKKILKKIEFIDIEDLESFVTGKYDFSREQTIDNIGEIFIRQNVSLQDSEKTEPFNVGAYSYNKDYGLYMLLGYENLEIKEKVELLLEALSYTGIGGKISSGFGKFNLISKSLPECFERRLKMTGKRYMSLSISLPRDDEFGDISAEDSYILTKRSGFVSSETYSNTFKKKKDFYMFKSGSCFKNKFNGDIYDVSIDGTHRVYRYAVPFWIEV